MLLPILFVAVAVVGSMASTKAAGAIVAGAEGVAALKRRRRALAKANEARVDAVSEVGADEIVFLDEGDVPPGAGSGKFQTMLQQARADAPSTPRVTDGDG